MPDPQKLAVQCDFLINRVRRNLRGLKAWLKRETVSCYRLYDCDIPEIPLVLDRYEDALVVAERRTFADQDPEERDAWARALGAAVAEALGIAPARCFYKLRRRQKANNQYEKLEARGALETVRENGLEFLVNFSDYLDTGLFLDHRPTRALVREWAAGRRVLNLFAYTGSFTVYAGAGGARTTTTVDLSPRYVDWARRNLAENGLSGPQHLFLEGDVMEWLATWQERGETYDLVILDPPTFSNSKRTETVLDVQRDHVRLLESCRRLLAPGGILLFSTNARRFKPEDGYFSQCGAEEISEATIPPDFRDHKVHRTWRFDA
jgi:23S rRNA G2069 N7-methylase RlmK/C1962 C5-methylase RlmI